MRGGSYWDRYTLARVSRRRLLRGGAIAAGAAGAIALVGCGDSSGGDAGSFTPVTSDAEVLNPLSPPVHGGRMVSSNSAGIGTFDPHVGIQAASAFFPRMYNLLLSQSTTRPEYVFMDLAESVEAVDELTYSFNIRQGVKIAPNDLGVPERPLDAEDVKVTFERLKTDPLTNQYSFASKFVDTVTASGKTVTIKTTEPYAWFIARISAIFNTIAPRELITGDPARMTSAGAGAGAYMLVDVGENENALFQRNPNYYRKDEANGEQLPYIDEFEYQVIFDRAPWRTAFLSGQVHQYWPQSGEEARQLGDYPIDRNPLFSFIAFTMNPERTPFQDPRVRRAISRAINRQQFVDIIYGGDAQADGLVHWPVGSYALSAEELEAEYQPFDLEEAKRLVEEVGGITFKMMYPANTTIWEHGQHLPIFVQQMREAGIDVQEDPQEFGTWVTGYQSLNYDSSLALNQMYETPELPLLFHTTGGPFGDKTYIQGIGDAEIDAAVSRANVALDADERLAAVHDAQKVIYSKDPAFFPLVSPYLYTAYSQKLHNIPSGLGTTAYSLSDYWLES